ncbi:Hypothetical protein i Rubrerythrin cluster [hydrothermal vent metagenome]|uniref:DUF3501 domain-containing protein n=1 Tax=hydrothermal vent metagenome TaxID=652676 RepID=A0A3B0YNR7_9ZZZZ
MEKLIRSDLYSLEQYAETRTEFRAQVIAHKKNRRVPLGDIAALYFEDRLTMRYQVQEMLRVERIFEAEGIEAELNAYNPLIPDGSNLKATFMIEVPDEEARNKALIQFKGIENEVWIRVDGFDPVFAIADEDLERENDEKTSAVHFMRFEFTADMVAAAKAGAALGAGISHSEYTQQFEPLPGDIRASLLQDFF